MRSCVKKYYPDQAAARVALASIRQRAAERSRPARLPVRVYPCDVCDGWHLTAKPLRGKLPPWDSDPTWVRPEPTTRLAPREAQREKVVPDVSSLRKRREALKRKIAVLTYDEVNTTLTPINRMLLLALRRELKTVNRMMHAPKRPKPSSGGARVVQGPASGVRRVVSGGAPGLGKRR